MKNKRFEARAVLFDLDGTLVDSRADIAGSVNFVLNRFGRAPLSEETVALYVGDGVRQLLGRSMGPMDEDTTRRALDLFVPHYLEHCTDRTVVYPGVKDLLGFWSQKALAVVTNKPEAHTWKTLAATGLRDFFSVVLGGDSLPERKPSPVPLQVALERLGVRPEQALMVGDSLMDIEAARAAGVAVAAVTYGFRPRVELVAAQPDFLCDRVSDLKEVVS